MGLAWTALGGSTLYVEAASVEKGEGKGSLKATGGYPVFPRVLRSWLSGWRLAVWLAACCWRGCLRMPVSDAARRRRCRWKWARARAASSQGFFGQGWAAFESGQAT